MLRHKIKFEKFTEDGEDVEEVEEDFYFNINKSELIELEVEHNEGLEKWVERIVKAEDRKTMFAEFKRIVLLAYGKKSEDGTSFIKSPELSQAFANHAAFDVLLTDLCTKDDFAAVFTKGILPRDLVGKMEEDPEAQKALQTPNS